MTRAALLFADLSPGITQTHGTVKYRFFCRAVTAVQAEITLTFELERFTGFSGFQRRLGIPQSAITKAEKHYGSSVLSDLIRSLKDIQNNSAHYYELADAMLIQHDFAQKLIGDVAPQVLANLS